MRDRRIDRVQRGWMSSLRAPIGGPPHRSRPAAHGPGAQHDSGSSTTRGGHQSQEGERQAETEAHDLALADAR